MIITLKRTLPRGCPLQNVNPNQGHAHAYLQKIYRDGEFRPNVPPDFTDSSFCALNRLNPSTVVGPGFVKGVCPSVSAPGLYRLCATLEQDAPGNRNKHHPRAFPSVDCRNVLVVGPRRKLD